MMTMIMMLLMMMIIIIIIIITCKAVGIRDNDTDGNY